MAPVAFADPKAKAAAHYKQGKAFFEGKQYTQAIAEYRAAYAIDKLAAHLFNIARAYQLAGDLNAAIENYQKFLDADPSSTNAAAARSAIVELTKQRDDAAAKRKADEDARRKQEELQKKRAIVEAHVKQAKAYELAGAWANAAEEYTFAGVHEPEQLLAAAQAFRTVPDLVKARFALITYLDRVPTGPRSDEVRKDLATITREIEAAALSTPKPAVPHVDRPEPDPVPVRLGWSRWGVRAGVAISQGTANPLQSDNSGLVLGVGFEAGGFVRNQITARLAVRPEVTIALRRAAFDDDVMGQMIVVELSRAGASAGGLALLSLTAGGGVQLAGGGELAVMLRNRVNLNDSGLSDVTTFKTLEPAVLLGFVFEVGSTISLELRYRRTLTDVASDFGTALHTVSAGLAVGFGL